MARCVIVGGAPISDYGRAVSYIKNSDTVIYCDCGMKHLRGLGIAPDLIVGDFDSYEREHIPGDTEIIELNPVKDDTDTSHAVNVAVERGFDEFLLVGAAGRRLDHTLGNVYLMYRLFLLGKKAMIVDDISEMSIVGSRTVYFDDSMPYFSLLNITGKAAGVTVKNAKYPLENAEIFQTANDLGISNEVLPGHMASVSVGEGCLLLIRDIVG